MSRVVCAISGGVDSAVAALLLKRFGYKISGCFIRCWTNVDDDDDQNRTCSHHEDLATAELVCDRLQIPLTVKDYSKQYWTNVFEYFLSEYKAGFTPNPDVLCNRYIKFGCLLDEWKDKTDFLATGHYAAVRNDGPGGICRLAKSVDPIKDQTFFLSRLDGPKLNKVLFPLSRLSKKQVRLMAKQHGLDCVADRKDSTGICFIGKKSFAEFIDQYIENRPGPIVDHDSGAILGQHKGIHRHTIGQRLAVGSNAQSPFYICDKDPETKTLTVASSSTHPALYSTSFRTDVPHWINPSEGVPTGRDETLHFKFQHKHREAKCVVRNKDGHGLEVFLPFPFRALTPGQYAVFYREDVCLGSGRIVGTTRLNPLTISNHIVNSDKILCKT